MSLSTEWQWESTSAVAGPIAFSTASKTQAGVSMRPQVGLDCSGPGPARDELRVQPTNIGRIASMRQGLVVGPPESRRHIPAISGKVHRNGRADPRPPTSSGDEREGP
jgi:hypothetical protein